MMRFKPGPERTRLGFVSAVLEAFQFVTREYPFVLLQTTPTLVEFEAPHALLTVFHARGSYELGAEFRQIGARGISEAPFEIREIIRAFGGSPDACISLAASRPDLVTKLVPKLAQLVRTHAAPLLRNDPRVFESLVRDRQLRRQLFVEGERINEVRTAAEAAWRGKDFGEVVRLLEPLNGNLSSLEAKRLEYAKKHST